MNTFDEVMKTYLEMLSKAPKECQECTRRHFIGCDGCSNQKYWGEKKEKHNA
jgi:hypothetical protein